jgi:hypothetical protein
MPAADDGEPPVPPPSPSPDPMSTRAPRPRSTGGSPDRPHLCTWAMGTQGGRRPRRTNAAQGAPTPDRRVTSRSRRQLPGSTCRRERAWRQPDLTGGVHVLTVPAGKCVAACRRSVPRWARRGKLHPLHQEGGARDVRSSSDASRGCSLASLETNCGRPQESGSARDPEGAFYHQPDSATALSAWMPGVCTATDSGTEVRMIEDRGADSQLPLGQHR